MAKGLILGGMIAAGTALHVTPAFAAACDKTASVGEIKVEKDWVLSVQTGSFTQTGPETTFVEIKLPDCGNNGVSAVIPTATQVFETIKKYQNGTLHPNLVDRKGICAYYQAAEILNDIKSDPEAHGFTAGQLNYSPDMSYKKQEFYKGMKLCFTGV